MDSASQAESNRLQLPSRLPSLTGLRFIAAALVFAEHIGYQWGPGPVPGGPLFAVPATFIEYRSIFSLGGEAGVSFFFMLSGFVLTWAARPKDSARAFWRRRFFKVYPNHLLNCAVLLLMYAGVSGLAIGKGNTALNALLVQSWIPKFNVSLRKSCERACCYPARRLAAVTPVMVLSHEGPGPDGGG